MSKSKREPMDENYDKAKAGHEEILMNLFAGITPEVRERILDGQCGAGVIVLVNSLLNDFADACPRAGLSDEQLYSLQAAALETIVAAVLMGGRMEHVEPMHAPKENAGAAVKEIG